MCMISVILYGLFIWMINSTNEQQQASKQVPDSTKNQPYVHHTVYHSSAYSPSNNSIYFLSADTLRSYNISDQIWKIEWTGTFPEHELEIGVDTLRNRLLIWSAGLGHVYEAPIRDGIDIKRIDNSFPHKNQYEHGFAIDPSDGNIIAFGGYGYWQDKNLITKFVQETGEWEITLWNDGPFPRARTYPHFDIWLNGNAYIVHGGFSNVQPEKPYVTNRVPLYDIWSFDIDRKMWTQWDDFPIKTDEIKPSVFMTGYRSKATSSIIQSDDLLIGIDRHHSNTRGYSVFAVDLKSGKGGFIPIHADRPAHSERVLGMAINENDRVMYIVWAPVLINLRPSPISVTEVNLPPADEIRLHIDREYRRILGIQEPILSRYPYWTMYIGGVIVIAIGFMTASYVLTRKAIKSNSTDGYDSSSLPLAVLRIQLSSVCENTAIFINDDNLSDEFTDDEILLMKMFANNIRSGTPFLSTDLIEQTLWKSTVNIDYNRKMRNQIQKRLEDTLQRLLPKQNGDHWIISRNNPGDKRRKEYYLYADPYKLVIDESNLSSDLAISSDSDTK